MGRIQTRPATTDDSDLAFRIKEAAFRGYVEAFSVWDEGRERALHKRRFGSQNFRIIQLDGVDCGVLATEDTPDVLKLNQLYILPEYQSRGIGSECLRRVLAEASEKQLPVRLRVLKVNPRAITFYERHGFVAADETPTHILMQGNPGSRPPASRP